MPFDKKKIGPEDSAKLSSEPNNNTNTECYMSSLNLAYSSAKINRTSLNCINFKAFSAIKSEFELTNLEALLFSNISFGLQNTHLSTPNLGKYIARNLEKLSLSIGGPSKKRVSEALISLFSKGLISKKLGRWAGKKSLLISCAKKIEQSDQIINHQKFSALTCQLGGVDETLLWMRILFALQKTTIVADGQSWCCINDQYLSKFLGVSEKTIYRIRTGLIRHGFLSIKKLNFNGRSRNHYSIPDEVIENLKLKIVDNFQKNADQKNTKSQFCPVMTGQNRLINLKEKKTRELKTNYSGGKFVDKKTDPKGGIVLNNKIKNKKRYIQAALERTIARKNLAVSNPKQLLAEVEFAILETENRAGRSFTHLVNSTMSILSDRNWRTPKGFFNHSAAGQEIKNHREKQAERWEQQKAEEMALIHSDFLGDVFGNDEQKRLNDKAKDVLGEIEQLKKNAIHGKITASTADTLIQGKIKLLSILLQQGAKIED